MKDFGKSDKHVTRKLERRSREMLIASNRVACGDFLGINQSNRNVSTDRESANFLGSPLKRKRLG